MSWIALGKGVWRVGSGLLQRDAGKVGHGLLNVASGAVGMAVKATLDEELGERICEIGDADQDLA